MSIHRPPCESWDCMLPGPPSRSNGGAADLSTTGLLAYVAGSSISIVETHSMELITTIPLFSSSAPSPALASFITALRWSLLGLPRHLISSDTTSHHLTLAVGDRQGRICIPDFRSQSPLISFESSSTQNLGIQDLCWVQIEPESWILAAIAGPSLLCLFNTCTGRCFFKYDSSPEYLSCLRRDPFDSRRFCALGLKGFLLSIKALGDSHDDIALKELQIRTDALELQKLERDLTTSSTGAPTLATFPKHVVRFSFSPHWKHILFVAFLRELVVFDLLYEMALYSTGLPRGCGKLLKVLPDTNIEVLYCAHLDGKLSTWQRKEGEQVYVMGAMEELIPSIGTSMPSPSVLGVVISHSYSTLQSINKLYSDGHHSLYLEPDNPFDYFDESPVISKTPLVSISDDGKVWKWLLTAEGSRNAEKSANKFTIVVDVCKAHDSTPRKIMSDGSLTKESIFHTRGIHASHFSPDSELLYFVSSVPDLELVVFDRAIGKLKQFGVNRPVGYPIMIQFVESFVQLNGISCVQERHEHEKEEREEIDEDVTEAEGQLILA